MRLGRLAFAAAAILLASMSALPAASDRVPSDGRVPPTVPPVDPEQALSHPTRPEPRPSAPAGRSNCARELLLDPKTQPALHIGLKTYPRTLALAEKEIVLTFDDGPDPETTPLILATLKQACVRAMFFLIGRHAAMHPELARRERDEGHTVGHHSYTHPPFTLRGFDTESAKKDIDDGIAADDAAVYPDADDKPSDRPRVPFFRFPGFADTPDLLDYLDRRHIAVFGADLWAADWLDMSPERERARVLRLLRETKHHNGILLFHDTRRSTAAMLPDLLDDLTREGYTFVIPRYEPLAKPVPLTRPRKGWTSETERIIGRLRTPIRPGAHHLGESPREPVEPEAAKDGLPP